MLADPSTDREALRSMLRVRAFLTILLAASALTVAACGESEEDKAKS